jgi:hypothetical protein
MKELIQFAVKPTWATEYSAHERFRLPQLETACDMAKGATSIGDYYFTKMLDPSMDWRDVEGMVKQWNDQFCLKGIISVADAKRAVYIGCRFESRGSIFIVDDDPEAAFRVTAATGIFCASGGDKEHSQKL